MTKFFFSENYNKRMEEIEDFIFQSTGSIEQVSLFLDEHDRILKFIEYNPKTLAVHPVTGDQSWVFGDGRYRLFCRVVQHAGDINVYLTHVIDNRRLNMNVYPANSIPTYEED